MMNSSTACSKCLNSALKLGRLNVNFNRAQIGQFARVAQRSVTGLAQPKSPFVFGLEEASKLRCGLSASSRFFSSKDGSLASTVQKEIAHEQGNYEQDPDIETFLKKSGWDLVEKDNDMMVSLIKQVGSRKVVIEFSCIQNGDVGGEDGPLPEMSDFTVTATRSDGSGVTFYCSTTQDGEDSHRYCIGQVRHFKDAQSKDSLEAYPGPYFEDLDDAFQQNLDEWLAEIGVDADLCDFIDRYAVDKENREYLNWLQNFKQFLQ